MGKKSFSSKKGFVLILGQGKFRGKTPYDDEERVPDKDSKEEVLKRLSIIKKY